MGATSTTTTAAKPGSANMMGSLMAAGLIMQAGGSISGALAQSAALRSQGDIQKSIYDANARMADVAAEDALRRGKKAQTQVRKAARKLQGSQRAAFAAQGIDPNAGSAADIQEETEVMGALDALTVKNNAWREAWGYRAQALGSEYQGAFAQTAGRVAGRNTLLTGAFDATGYGLRAAAAYKSR